MSLTIEQKEEIVAIIDAVMKTSSLVDKVRVWLPTALCLASVIGGGYVTYYKADQNREAIKDLFISKADRSEIVNLKENTELKFEVVRGDIRNLSSNVASSNLEIKNAQSEILRELREIKRK